MKDEAATRIPEPRPERSEAPETTGPVPPLIADRYEVREELGRGGSSSVWRVWDRQLERSVALKVLHARRVAAGGWLRFEAEARLSAQLQHPGIVPVHDLGRLEDGRAWFTMMEVQGTTLDALIEGVDRGEQDPGNLRRLLETLLRVCETVSFAHANGVVHRDLKPANVMVGRFGEVFVLDWGLAKRPLDTVADDNNGPHTTRAGVVSGTPLYMSPEQARGDSAMAGPPADVYALGATLYKVLTGRPPRNHPDVQALIRAVAAGEPFEPPSTYGSGPAHDPALERIVLRALATSPDERYPDAGALAGQLAAWLDGARRRADALKVVAAADTVVDEVDVLLEQATALEVQGEGLLDGIPSWAPEDEKIPAWRCLDEAIAVRRRALRKLVEAERLLHAALRVDADLPEARIRLLHRLVEQHREAEQQRDEDEMVRHALALREHAHALPRTHPKRAQVEAYLCGDGTLTLHTDPTGACVAIHRFVLENRRLVEVGTPFAGATPVVRMRLAMGRYVAVITHPSCDPVRYPFEITREGGWDGVPPDGTQSQPVWLPPRGTLAKDEVYVPAGWFRCGGDDRAQHPLPADRLWCAGFVISRFMVTNEEFVAFLNDLVDQSRVEEAEIYAPRERAPGNRMSGPVVLSRDENGRFLLGADSEGQEWHPRVPIVLLDQTCYAGFLRWKSVIRGHMLRLPLGLEVEKAARGVDGRYFPWGDRADPSWCCVGGSHPGERSPVSVDAFPVDCSVYGMRGGAGNVLSSCNQPFRAAPIASNGRVEAIEAGPNDRILVARGGSWASGLSRSRCASRTRVEDHRSSVVGFRVVWSIGDWRTA